VADENELRVAFRAVMAGRPKGTAVVLQPMCNPGIEMILGAMQHGQFGPVVMVGAGGVVADVLADHEFRPR
jgi:acyl-CoA synthetase (NDP forming)